MVSMIEHTSLQEANGVKSDMLCKKTVSFILVDIVSTSEVSRIEHETSCFSILLKSTATVIFTQLNGLHRELDG